MRIQEQALGGLDRESLMFLDGLARRGVSPHRHLKPGTVLVREYQGERHTVTVGREGFEWQGTTYTSLSAIARARNAVMPQASGVPMLRLPPRTPMCDCSIVIAQRVVDVAQRHGLGALHGVRQ
jgi:hypothetical protein